MARDSQTCDACGTGCVRDPVKTAMPPGWKMHRIKDRSFLLCETCGGPAYHQGGLAPILKEMLAKRHGVKFDPDD